MPRRKRKAWVKTDHWVRPPDLAHRPPPWKSPLWAHLEDLRAWTNQRPRLTWKEIAQRLEEAKGLKVPWRTLYKFYARTDRRIREGKLPLGMKLADRFEPPRAPAKPVPAKQAEPSLPASEDVLEGYWQRVSQAKSEKRSSLFTPDKLQ